MMTSGAIPAFDGVTATHTQGEEPMEWCREPWSCFCEEALRQPAALSRTRSLLCPIVVIGLAGPGGSGSDYVMEAVREGMSALLAAAFDEAGVGWAACHREWRGDIVVIAVPPGVPPEVLLDQLVTRLRARLRMHNKLASDIAQIRLGMALHVGKIIFAPEGLSGGNVTRLTELLRVPEFVGEFEKSSADLGLVASDYVYEEVIQHDFGLIDPAAYEPVTVPGCRAQRPGWPVAWMYFPPGPRDKRAASNGSRGQRNAALSEDGTAGSRSSQEASGPSEEGAVPGDGDEMSPPGRVGDRDRRLAGKLDQPALERDLDDDVVVTGDLAAVRRQDDPAGRSAGVPGHRATRGGQLQLGGRVRAAEIDRARSHGEDAVAGRHRGDLPRVSGAVVLCRRVTWYAVRRLPDRRCRPRLGRPGRVHRGDRRFWPVRGPDQPRDRPAGADQERRGDRRHGRADHPAGGEQPASGEMGRYIGLAGEPIGVEGAAAGRDVRAIAGQLGIGPGMDHPMTQRRGQRRRRHQIEQRGQ
jgi:hypothetical protein